jgi:hypothetical protein
MGQGGQNGGGFQGGYRGTGQWNPNGPRMGPNGGPWNGDPQGGPFAGWDPRANPNGPITPLEFQQTYRDTMQALNQLQGQIGNDPAMAKDVQNLIREMQRMNPFTYGNDPLLSERIQATLAQVEQVELELRRKVDETGGGSVRSPGNEVVPQGYADAVAEYFRKLSKNK